MKHQLEFGTLLRHSYLLRSSINLAYDRDQQLEQTIHNLGFSSMPAEPEGRTAVQMAAAREIGGINVRMLLDAPQEIEKYHFGPLQIALCLLYAIIERYKELSKTCPSFRDDSVDKYCSENERFILHLKDLRDSVLHQRHDNLAKQMNALKEFDGEANKHILDLLLGGESIYRDYLRNLWRLLQEGGRNNDRQS